jgi:cell division protein FtsZ
LKKNTKIKKSKIKAKTKVRARKMAKGKKSDSEKSKQQKTKFKEMPLARIKVVGVGGGGGNAISRMRDDFPRGIELIAVNTDIQDLNQCEAKKKVYIGKNLTRGLGTGMNPDLGHQAAEENRSDIAEAIKDADMIFIAAGMGGGTGTGAAPVVADIAKEMGILTIAIVTKPFSFEGGHRARIAEEGLIKLRDRVDTIITIPNDRIFSIINKETSLMKAFEEVDKVLRDSVKGITELILTPGIINIDFADIKSIMRDAGSAIVGIGIASGQNRAMKAASIAVNSPLLEVSIEGAKGILFSISGRNDMKMQEINEIAKTISEHVDPTAKIIFGTYFDRKLNKGQIKITLIATGFSNILLKETKFFPNIFNQSGVDENLEIGTNNNHLPFVKEEKSAKSNKEKKEDSKKEETTEKKQAVKDNLKKEEDDREKEWEVPAFLRRKRK